MKSVKLDERSWCGPSALAAAMGITYDEADALYRRIRKQKRRIVHTSAANTRRAMEIIRKKRGLKGPVNIIELVMEDGSVMPKERRPRISSFKDLNQIARIYPNETPVMLIVGKTHDRSRHIVAYDHRRKMLCDNWSHGKVLPIKDHPLRDWFVFKMFTVPNG